MEIELIYTIKAEKPSDVTNLIQELESEIGMLPSVIRIKKQFVGTIQDYALEKELHKVFG